MISEEDKIMMETLYWWGIPTLFRCKNDPDPKNCDIALVGVPHSTGNGTTERDQHLGPRAVRNISAMLRRSHFDYKICLLYTSPSPRDRSVSRMPSSA